MTVGEKIQGLDFYVGAYHATIDAKNRFVVPAEIRAVLENRSELNVLYFMKDEAYHYLHVFDHSYLKMHPEIKADEIYFSMIDCQNRCLMPSEFRELFENSREIIIKADSSRDKIILESENGERI